MNRYEMPYCNQLIVDFEKLLSNILGEPVSIMLRYVAYKIEIDEIKTMVCESFGMPWQKVISDTRKKEVVYARMSFAYLAKTYTSMSDSEIGQYIKKERTTVMANVQTITHLLFVQDVNVYPFLSSIIEIIQTQKSTNETKKLSNQINQGYAGSPAQHHTNAAINQSAG